MASPLALLKHLFSVPSTRPEPNFRAELDGDTSARSRNANPIIIFIIIIPTLIIIIIIVILTLIIIIIILTLIIVIIVSLPVCLPVEVPFAVTVPSVEKRRTKHRGFLKRDPPLFVSGEGFTDSVWMLFASWSPEKAAVTVTQTLTESSRRSPSSATVNDPGRCLVVGRRCPTTATSSILQTWFSATRFRGRNGCGGGARSRGGAVDLVP